MRGILEEWKHKLNLRRLRRLLIALCAAASDEE